MHTLMKPRFYRLGHAHDDPFFDDGIGCNGINAGIQRGRFQMMVSRYRGWSAFIAWNDVAHWVSVSLTGSHGLSVQYNDHGINIGRRISSY